MNKELNEEMSLLSVLSENYEALYYVDFDKNTIKPYRMSPIIEEKFGDYFRTAPSYEEAMTGYINVVVAPEDKENMLRRAKPEYIREKLRNRRVYAYDFRVNRNGRKLCYRIKISNLEGVGELHKAVVGFADVTPEMDRVNQLIESHALLKLLEKDELTGLYAKEFFFKKVKEYLEDHPNEDLAFWTSDVRGLKVINEKYGMEKGDFVLQKMAQLGQDFPGFIFGGRIEGDKLSALVVDNKPATEALKEILHENTGEDIPVPNLIIKHGIYHIQKNDTLSIQGMYDRSLLALQSIKDKFGVYVAHYDDRLREELLMNRQIMEQADDSLAKGEFQVYLQPKVGAPSGKIEGAEALVRWNNPEFGFMSPGIFIPLFEKNGFISQLDYFIWEEICKLLHEWKEKQIPLFPISVNVSRCDFEEENLADKIIQLVDKYEVDHSLFQIEVTESAYTDDAENIEKTIKVLHDNGFSIAMDDFGTGYTSLMALGRLDLDVLKLDMKLIQNDVPGTEKNILELAMQLAKMMKLSTVAEGVETKEQVERIKSLGGDLIQGYFYSKPLSVPDYLEYIHTK